MSSKKVYLETFGCQMNVSDSERVATALAADGFQMTDIEAEADVVLINTCSVREKAEQKLFTRVGQIRKASAERFLSSGGENSTDGISAPETFKENRYKKNAENIKSAAAKKKPLLGILGCVAQLEGETLLARRPEIDFVVGTKASGRVGQMIREIDSGAERIFDLGEREDFYDWSVNAAQRHSPHVAFVPIIEGCNKFCTYCIVPFSRGREKSLTAAQIVRHVQKLRAEGTREVHLIGQNVNSFRPQTDDGMENFKGATAFSRLLRAVAATGIERVKFTTSFPRDFHADIVDAIDENPNLCNWAHLPVQTGSNRILKAMRRGHTIENYLERVAKIKSSPRRIALTTDLIVGFPNETERDFSDTLRLVELCQFNSAYIFKYSPRPGTPAFEMEDDVSAAEKTARFLELEKMIKVNQQMIFKNYLDRIVSVLVEKVSEKDPAQMSGHSTCQTVVNFQGSSQFLGKIVNVRITETKANTLFGVVV